MSVLLEASHTLEVELQVHSGAIGKMGLGIFWNGRWSGEKWPVSWVESELVIDLKFLEFFSILVAVFEQRTSNRIVKFWCDNKAVVHFINSKSPCPADL